MHAPCANWGFPTLRPTRDSTHEAHTGVRTGHAPADRTRHSPPPGGAAPPHHHPRGIVLSQNAVSHAKPALEPPRTQAGANDADAEAKAEAEGSTRAGAGTADTDVDADVDTEVARGAASGAAVGQARTGPDPRLGPPGPRGPPARRGHPRPGGAATPGGVLTRSPRVGLDGRVFVLRSLRTRRLRLDLLSRLPHVVRGDLSLVGPAPLAPDEEDGPRVQGETRTPGSGTSPAARHWRHELKPGLTGLAQVHSRSGMPWDEPALLDQHYAEHQWVGLDLAILVRAAHAPLRRAARGLARPGKGHLSDTDHRLSGYSTAEEVGSVSTD